MAATSGLPCLTTTRPDGLENVPRHQFRHRHHVQNGEDGIIQAAYDCMGTVDKTFVEFGVENGMECNTRLLREKHGWTG